MEIKITGKLRLFLFGLIVVLLLAILNFLLTRSEKVPIEKRPTVSLPPLFKESEEKPAGFSYSGLPPTLPKEAKIFTLKEATLTLEEAEKIARTLNFESEPVVSEDKVDGRILFWQNPEATLYVRLKQKVSEYRIKNINLEEKTPLEFSRAKEVAKDFLSSRQLFEGLTFSENYTHLSGLKVEPQRSEKENSEGLRVSLDYSIEGRPLVDSFLGVEPVSLILTNNGEVVSLSYALFRLSDLSTTMMMTVPLKSFEEVRENLGSGKDLSVGLLDEGATGKKVTGPPSLTSISLGYFRSVEARKVRPVFIVEGTSGKIFVDAVER